MKAEEFDDEEDTQVIRDKAKLLRDACKVAAKQLDAESERILREYVARSTIPPSR